MKNTHVVICGASMGTKNLGVSALCNSALASINTKLSSVAFTVLDSDKGIRETQLYDGERMVGATLCGAKYSKRFYQKESFLSINFFADTVPRLNKNAQHLLNAKAFLDVSGGDSFTDLYGNFRFNLILAPKKFAIKNKIPLVLLPQTYGPFSDESNKLEASKIVKVARMAWARDAHSFSILKNLLGEDFDPNRHKVGVDMAFLLPEKKCPEKINRKVRDWIEDKNRPVVGININGLIYNDSEKAKNQYGFVADYHECLRKIVGSLIDSSNVNVVLVPHVLTEVGHYESDYQACVDLLSGLTSIDKSRIEIQLPELDQCEVKWLIGRMDWFMGTRMHATIAALSTKTPVCTISYSDKAQGVFETCGMGSYVFDPRELSTGDVVEKVLDAYKKRSDMVSILDTGVDAVKKTASQQMDDIVACLAEVS